MHLEPPPKSAEASRDEVRPPWVRGLLLAAVALILLTLGSFVVDARGGKPTLFLLYPAAVLLASWYGGLRAGLAATVLAALLGQYFILPPRLDWGGDPSRLALFLVEAVSISIVTARVARSRQHSLASLREGRAALDKLHAVLDGVDDGILVQDTAGRVLYANEGAAAVLGFPSLDALLRTSVADATQHFEVLDEDRRPLAPTEMPGRTALRTGLPVERVLLFRAPGTGEEHWTIVRSKPLYDAQKRPESVITVLSDVTQRRREEVRRGVIARAAQALSSSLDYPETLSRVAWLAVPEFADWAAVDLVEGGRVERLAVAHVDPEKIALAKEIEQRYPDDRITSAAVSQVIHTGRAVLVTDIPDTAFEAAARDPEHLALIRALGLRSYLSVPLLERGSAIGALTFVTAESQRRYGPEDLALATALADRAAVAIEHARLYRETEKARADAERANRSKDEFLAMLGHELRNPLAPILTAVALLRMRGGPTPETAVIERQVKHVVRLVDDLLDISRITRGKVELKLERLDLSDIVARAVEMAMPLIEQRSHRLEVDVPLGMTVRGDAVRLAQVVANLLNNAAKYMEKGGSIGVRADRVGSAVELRVRDKGIGIAPAMLPRVFDMFAQETQAIDRAQGGLGLGLAIVKSLVALHGGEVSAASDGVGAGSEFCVRLPALDGEITSRTSLPTDRFGSRTSQPVRVLVVDDNDDAADLLADVLSALGHDVSKAHDGPSALAMAAQHRPSLALLDIGLPVMDGYELARRLRAMEGLGGIKLVAVTGYGQESDRRRSKDAGFDAHLVKPIDLEALPALVSKLTRPPPS
jgi:PAS domain S-box-containing protein